jgi:hypothetical protein
VPVQSKNSSWSLPRSRNHCSAYVDDKSGPGGLWEIPGILKYMMYVNICADREPIAGCPFNPYPLPCRSTSAGLPAVLDTAELPCFPLPPAKETKSDTQHAKNHDQGWSPKFSLPVSRLQLLKLQHSSRTQYTWLNDDAILWLVPGLRNQ